MKLKIDETYLLQNTEHNIMVQLRSIQGFWSNKDLAIVKVIEALNYKDIHIVGLTFLVNKSDLYYVIEPNDILKEMVR